VYRSDVADADLPAGIVPIVDERGRSLGQGLWSPRSEIRLRRLTAGSEPVDGDWWIRQVERARLRREALDIDATAYRVVHAEGDGLPSLVVDRYGDVVVAQFLSAGIEAVRADVLAAITEVLQPAGVLLRNDASVRRHEGLPLSVEVAHGQVPDRLEVREGSVRHIVRLHESQKTGAFLDQRENHLLMGRLARGRALDVFTYQGHFALHMARRADSVQAIDSSAAALDAARVSADLNDYRAIEWVEANAFDHLRALESGGERFDTIVLDPPAFAKTRQNVDRALAGYKEINLRAMRLLFPGGLLFTCSCSYHVDRERFGAMLAAAAADSGRRVALVAPVGQGGDHPELLTVPETGYLKGALLRVEA
jgi:23S rRNA (cytosine1962-C5)-methyltransferase